MYFWEYYEASVMQCVACQQNASLTTSADGFSCTCMENSIPVSPARCRPCGVTELVSSDGAACVPRRCHTAAGRVACRKCPREYITVTQNIDGSPMKEVQCIKCAKGFKPQNNQCVRCEACSCSKLEAVIAGICIPKKFLMSRPKYTDNKLHPGVLMELVKLEYLCTEQDILACRRLGHACVKSFYSVDVAGPCNLSFKPNTTIKGLPPLAFPFSKNDEEFYLEHGMRGLWPSNKFRKFFLVDKYLSIATNVTEMVYLRTLLLQISITREVSKSGLKFTLNVEAHYETKSPLADAITTTFEVQHQMPQAGVTRSLEILGGVFGAAMSVYAAVQWRGAVKRGALLVTIVPVLASAVADALYFATLLSTLHALAAEAGTLGLTLPLSKTEDNLITAMIYSAVALKVLKVIWVNIKQSRSHILFIDWSKYNPSFNEVEVTDSSDWRTAMVGKEWNSIRCQRRVSPAVTAAIALLILHFLDLRLSIPQSQGYKWCITTLAWWLSYITLLLARYALDLAAGSPTAELPRVCGGVGVSVLVFQEERYAHYVNGRNDAILDYKMITGSLATCRLFCSPQLREIYTKLSTASYGEFGQDPNGVLLTKFMAAFFERALDGLNWVASERTTLERLLDVELVDREGGNTSVLLYDNDVTPSCFAVTWWGEEWLLATFDAMLFDCVYISTGQPLLAAIVTLTMWQVMELANTVLWNRTIQVNWSMEKMIVHNVRF
ncbi:meckelin-like [Aricia agestis]|uniref:meckelin-like n=1 Tax=Aricia agestis TaxID=91739 RepID=UPI001C20A74E|nr:meckelin-like [Aricia agestis]